MNILIFPNFSKELTMSVLEKVYRILISEGHSVFMLKQYRAVVSRFSDQIVFIEEKLTEVCDLLIAIGGDGTLIRYAHYAAIYGMPIVGVSTGTLGYMTEIDLEHLDEDMVRLLNGEYTLQSRYALCAVWEGKELPFVLNDFLLSSKEPFTLSDYKVCRNGHLIDIYRADGILFATPTGSTAQAIAYGGPIIEPGMAAILLQPVGVQLGMRTPYILNNECILTVTAKQELVLIADGEKQGRLSAGSVLSIKKSSYTAKFVSLNHQTSIYRMQEKIGELRRKLSQN